MARIIGAIGCSHTPTIAYALDTGKQEDPAWKPIFEAFAPVKHWVAINRPDVIFTIYNDHITSFFFDQYPMFALGVGDKYRPADEGGGARDLPLIDGHAGLSRHIAQSLAADEFDLTVFRDKPLDHGCFSPLSLVIPYNDTQWDGRIIPLQVGVLQFPIPSAARCYKLGQALRNAIESYPDDLRVAILATGGLSHQVHGERSGFNNVEWDDHFLSLLEKDPVALTRLSHADYARLGGMESSEVIMWLIMRGALSGSITCRHRAYYLPSMTGIATVIYENDGEPMSDEQAANHRKHIGSQLDGIEELEGTYPYTLERSARGFRVNKLLHALIDPDFREKFLADEDAAYAADGGGSGPCASPRLAGPDPLWCDLLPAGKARRCLGYPAFQSLC